MWNSPRRTIESYIHFAATHWTTNIATCRRPALPSEPQLSYSHPSNPPPPPRSQCTIMNSINSGEKSWTCDVFFDRTKGQGMLLGGWSGCYICTPEPTALPLPCSRATDRTSPHLFPIWEHFIFFIWWDNKTTWLVLWEDDDLYEVSNIISNSTHSVNALLSQYCFCGFSPNS